MNKKGFTLVELLAVIVILAIVALVVVPVVMGVIKDARKKSAIESFRGYMDAVEKTIMRDSMKTTSELPNKDSNGCYSLRELDSKVKVKGDHPEIEETDKLCVENGKIKSISEVEMNGYALEYKDGDILLNGQAIEDKTIPEITIGEITATKNSITIPYEVQSGKSGVTVTCEYGKTDSYGNNGTIEDNKCILSNLEEETKYYFRLNSKTGKNKTSSQAGSEFTTCEYTINQQFNFDYTGNVQEFSPKCIGKYKLEVWGAQGGAGGQDASINGYGPTKLDGGYGGYSIGQINLSKNQKIYIVIGGKGVDGYGTTTSGYTPAGGYNGGGSGGSYDYPSNHGHGGAGGGATHIGLKSAILTSFSSDYSTNLLLVAGGGGGSAGSSSPGKGGHGGGSNGKSGETGTVFNTGSITVPGGAAGTQSSGNSFGKGANAGNTHAGGGGGGFYGGIQGGHTTSDSETGGGGGGGSGYLNTSKLTNYGMYGYTGVSGANTTSTTSTGSHVANAANTGNGYARITYLGK